jgi:hypothetical protein
MCQRLPYMEGTHAHVPLLDPHGALAAGARDFLVEKGEFSEGVEITRRGREAKQRTASRVLANSD